MAAAFGGEGMIPALDEELVELDALLNSDMATIDEREMVLREALGIGRG